MAKMSTRKTRAALTGALFLFACMIQSAFAGALPNASLRSSRQAQIDLPPTLDYETTDPMILEGEMGTEMAEDLSTASPVPILEEVIKEEADATTGSGTISRRKKSRSVRFPHKELMKKYGFALTAALLSTAAAGLGTAWFKKSRKEQRTAVPAFAEELAEIVEEPKLHLVDAPAASSLKPYLNRAAMLSAGLAFAAGLYFLYTTPEDTGGLIKHLFNISTVPENATLGAQKTETPEPLDNLTAKNTV